MKYIIIFFGALILLCGLYMLFDPDYFFDLLKANSGTQWVFFSAIIVRLVLGALLYLTAKESRFPLFMKFLAYVVILAALLLIVLGQDKFQELVISVLAYLRSFALMATLIVIAFGVFLIYAYTAKRSTS